MLETKQECLSVTRDLRSVLFKDAGIASEAGARSINVVHQWRDNWIVTTVSMRFTVLQDMMPCSLVER